MLFDNVHMDTIKKHYTRKTRKWPPLRTAFLII